MLLCTCIFRKESAKGPILSKRLYLRNALGGPFVQARGVVGGGPPPTTLVGEGGLHLPKGMREA